MSHTTSTSQRQRSTRRRTIVAKASFSEDDDAITPCSSPPPEPTDASAHQSLPQRFPSFRHAFGKLGGGSRSGASSPKEASAAATESWQFDPTHGEDLSDAELWQRMLEIQRNFHCYNSARMSAALLELEMGVDAGHFTPSRSCLVLMNESISELSEDERLRLSEWMEENSTSRRMSALWKRAAVFH